MAEQFYQREIFTLIRANQLIKNQLKIFKTSSLKLIKSLLNFLHPNFKPKDDTNPIDQFLHLKQPDLIAFQSIGKLIETLESMSWAEVKSRRDELQRLEHLEVQKLSMMKVEHMLSQLLKPSPSPSQQTLMEENRKNLTFKKQLETQLQRLKQQYETSSKTILTLKSISKELQAQLIESNYLHQVERRSVKEETTKLKNQIERLNRELKKMHYAYDKLCQNSHERLFLIEEESLQKSRRSKR